MSPFRFLERLLFLGEVIHEYEPLRKTHLGVIKEQVKFFLCQRRGRLQLVIRNSAWSFFGGRTSYSYVDVTPESVAMLQRVALDLGDRVDVLGVRL